MNYTELQSKLFTAYKVTGDRAEKAFQLAWQWGHSSGESEVENYFAELMVLVK